MRAWSLASATEMTLWLSFKACSFELFNRFVATQIPKEWRIYSKRPQRMRNRGEANSAINLLSKSSAYPLHAVPWEQSLWSSALLVSAQRLNGRLQQRSKLSLVNCRDSQPMLGGSSVQLFANQSIKPTSSLPQGAS